MTLQKGLIILRPDSGLHDRPPKVNPIAHPKLLHLLIYGATSTCDTHRYQTSVRPKEPSEFVQDKDTIIYDQTSEHTKF